tara:strand:+ start:260 stop:481 length:222 start_codon:yes stop_codon:yes gene_type:complete
MIDLSAHRIVKITAERNWHELCQVIKLKITNDEGQDFKASLFTSDTVIPMKIEWIDENDYRSTVVWEETDDED